LKEIYKTDNETINSDDKTISNSYGNKRFNLLYMITPLKKEFNQYPTEQKDVQLELNEIRASAYSNFIYFPYNLKLIKFLEETEDDE
jgi:hypothetical protein